MTDHNTQESRNRAVLVGLNADSLPREDNASETTLEELAARYDGRFTHSQENGVFTAALLLKSASPAA